jgi:hypothetical protein
MACPTRGVRRGEFFGEKSSRKRLKHTLVDSVFDGDSNMSLVLTQIVVF